MQNKLSNRIQQLIVLLAVITLFACGDKQVDEQPVLNPVLKYLFVNPLYNHTKQELNDVQSIKHSITVSGIKIEETNSKSLKSLKLSDYDVLVLPYASARELDTVLNNKVIDAVKEGLDILLDGNTKLATNLGINLEEKPITVAHIRDGIFPKYYIYWKDSCLVRPIDTTKGTYGKVYFNEKTRQPIAVNGAYGKGKYIFFSELFDPLTTKGYSRYPFLIEHLNKVFGLSTLAEKAISEMYYDPGLDREDSTYSIEQLAALWRQEKIKTIYAAGWYFEEGYDYKRFIKACHANGILVMCWLEPPMVSEEFWDRFPAWREKTATLRDAHVDWRKLMNIFNPDCRKQIFLETKKLLLDFEWDGVNLAELYFEPTGGPESPEDFTPMSNEVRADFKARYGFDPYLIFDKKSPHSWRKNKADWHKLVSYRKNLSQELKKYYLDFLATVKLEKRDLEVMLTGIDVSLTPIISDYIGEVTENTLRLYKEYDITLQIEDPSACWGAKPERYSYLAKFYRPFVPDENKLVFDCNVVNSHPNGQGGFPCERPTGEEIRQIAYNMSIMHIRPAFYSEMTIYHHDFVNISRTLAREAIINGKNEKKWLINTPATIIVNTGQENWKLDGQPWAAGTNVFAIIPKGEHVLTLSSDNYSKLLRIKQISGNLLDGEFKEKELNFTYSEPYSSAYTIINKRPISIEIDNMKVNVSIISTDAKEYSIKLPKGNHKVKILSL